MDLALRLSLEGAQASLGHPKHAAAQEEAFTVLRRQDLPLPERLSLCRALARTFAAFPAETALAGLKRLEREELPKMTDSFNTNSHFCLAVIHFLESLISAHASDDLALGPKVQLWLDEEEYLVRRRIHRDMRALCV